MGQKINPTGFRLSVNRDWASKWYANSKHFPATLNEDIQDAGKSYKDAFTNSTDPLVKVLSDVGGALSGVADRVFSGFRGRGGGGSQPPSDEDSNNEGNNGNSK